MIDWKFMGKTIEISGIIEYVKVTENWEETFSSFYNMWWGSRDGDQTETI